MSRSASFHGAAEDAALDAALDDQVQSAMEGVDLADDVVTGDPWTFPDWLDMPNLNLDSVLGPSETRPPWLIPAAIAAAVIGAMILFDGDR